MMYSEIKQDRMYTYWNSQRSIQERAIIDYVPGPAFVGDFADAALMFVDIAAGRASRGRSTSAFEQLLSLQGKLAVRQATVVRKSSCNCVEKYMTNGDICPNPKG